MALADLETALALSAAVGSGAYMLTRTEVFAPLPKLLLDKSDNARSVRAKQFWLKLGRLFMCPYCTGTWLALFAVAIYRPVLVTIPYVRSAPSYWPLGYLVSVMAVNGTAMLWVLLIRRALSK